MSMLRKDVCQSNVKGLELILGHIQADLSTLDPRGDLLITAITHNDLDIIQVLIDFNSPLVCESSSNGLFPIHYTAKHHQIEVMQKLLDYKVPVDLVTKYDKRTALHLAVKSEHLETVRFLLEHKADPNSKDVYGCTPLHIAAFLGHVDTLKVLIDYKANVELQDYITWKPIHHAAINNQSEVVKILLQHHANINAQTKYGKTALHMACQKQHMESVECLVMSGADTHTIDVHGKIPKDYARGKTLHFMIANTTLCQSQEQNEYKSIPMQLGSKSLANFLDKNYIQPDYYGNMDTCKKNTSPLPVKVSPSNRKSVRKSSGILKSFRAKTARISSRISALRKQSKDCKEIISKKQQKEKEATNNNFDLINTNDIDHKNHKFKEDTDSLLQNCTMWSGDDMSYNLEIPRNAKCRNFTPGKLKRYKTTNEAETPVSYLTMPPVNPPSSTPKMSKEEALQFMDRDIEDSLAMSYLDGKVERDMVNDSSISLSAICASLTTVDLSTYHYTSDDIY